LWKRLPNEVHEALELRDADSSRFLDRGVEQAVVNANDVFEPGAIIEFTLNVNGIFAEN
jgi:enolase